MMVWVTQLGHWGAVLGTAAQQTVGLGLEGLFPVRSGRWSNRREGGSHQSFTRKGLD